MPVLMEFKLPAWMRERITEVMMSGHYLAWQFSLSRGTVVLCGGDETSLRLQIGDKLIQGTQSKQSSLLLRGHYHKKQLDASRMTVDQGKNFHSVAKHLSGNEWIGNGKYMSFTDYN